MPRKKLIASLLILLLLCLWASNAFALSIGSDTTFDVARMVVIPEDGSGGVAVADAIQFNIGFTVAAFFGYVTAYVKVLMEILR